MVPCLAAGEGAEGSVVTITVVEGNLAAMGIVVVVSAAAGAAGAGEARAEAGEVVEAGDGVEAGDIERAGKVVRVLGVAGVEETGKAEVLVGAVEEVEARRAGNVVMGGVAGARKSNIVKASTAAILAEIQPLSLPHWIERGSSGLRPRLEITFLQARLGRARSNISVLSYLTIMPCSVTTPLM